VYTACWNTYIKWCQQNNPSKDEQTFIILPKARDPYRADVLKVVIQRLMENVLYVTQIKLSQQSGPAVLIFYWSTPPLRINVEHIDILEALLLLFQNFGQPIVTNIDEDWYTKLSCFINACRKSFADFIVVVQRNYAWRKLEFQCIRRKRTHGPAPSTLFFAPLTVPNDAYGEFLPSDDDDEPEFIPLSV
jgi:hypothetical protein